MHMREREKELIGQGNCNSVRKITRREYTQKIT